MSPTFPSRLSPYTSPPIQMVEVEPYETHVVCKITFNSVMSELDFIKFRIWSPNRILQQQSGSLSSSNDKTFLLRFGLPEDEDPETCYQFQCLRSDEKGSLAIIGASVTFQRPTEQNRSNADSASHTDGASTPEVVSPNFLCFPP